MSEIIRKPYEISIWEDVLETDETTKLKKPYFKEKKIAVIGADDMTALSRARNPIFTRNTNGSFTLTFTLYSKYFDPFIGEMTDNPFLRLMVNERKIKLKYDNKWYDLIVKDIQENSSDQTFSYTATSLHINELSKNGFNIELKSDLMNNQGTITELAEKVVAGTDWRINSGSSDILQQTIEEPVYRITLNRDIAAVRMDTNSSVTITEGSVIYGFYSCLSEEKSFFQFLYSDNGKYEITDDRVIVNVSNYYIDNVTYSPNGNFSKPSFADTCTISTDYRGKRIVRSEPTIYDKVVDKVVNVYKDKSNKTVYGFTESEYITSASVSNFITSSEGFIPSNGEITGWKPDESTEIEPTTYPLISKDMESPPNNLNFYLRVKFEQIGKGSRLNSQVLNTGLKDNYGNAYLENGISIGDKWVLRMKVKWAEKANSKPADYYLTDMNILRGIISEYTLEEKNGVLAYTWEQDPETHDYPFRFGRDGAGFKKSTEDGYIYSIATCKQGITRNDIILKKIGLMLYPTTTLINGKKAEDYYYFIEDIQLFPYISDPNGTDGMVLPNSAPESKINTIYYYYRPDENIKDKNDITYIYKGDTPSTDFTPQYDLSYQKVRSIEASESNVFNIIQNLCEIFECWADFSIEHNQNTGEILLDENDNYRPKKWITFKEYIGQDNYVGFRYGINLTSITRDLASDQLVSKIVVKQNSNSYGKDGFCSIARARDNPIKENFLYNFNYYINQELLKYSDVTNDLYASTTASGYLGYYPRLKKINKNRDEKIENLAEITKSLPTIEANKTTYATAVSEAQEQKLAAESELKNYSGYTYKKLTDNPTGKAKDKLDDAEVKKFITKIQTLERLITSYKKLADTYEKSLSNETAKKEKIEKELEDFVKEKEVLNKEFYTKYSRFIQEGSWISEDYIDDNLYYLDAESTLYNSAFPQVTYTIKVIEISQEEDFKNYKYDIGDKTYIEDTEFFGWTYINGAKTPYKEEIIINEISNHLDSPEDDEIKVQNFKTQFEDLFQRITATSNAVQYHSGSYSKVAGIIEENGTIKVTTLQDSFFNNSLTLSNANDQSVIWDNTGITVVNLSSPNQMVRIVGGGIFVTQDGGEIWTAGITGQGINTAQLTAGQIDVNRINILSGAAPAFRWDSTGINAYNFEADENTGTGQYFNFNQFVRFDQYGIYGYRGDDSFIPENEQSVIDNSDFSLTWSGFKIKSNHTRDNEPDKGYISITSNNDFELVDGNGNLKIKIGRIGTELNNNEPQVVYGMKFFETEGTNNVVSLESTANGALYLRKTFTIGPNTYTPRTQIGVIETQGTGKEQFSKIFSVHNIAGEETIAFYDDGRMVAGNVNFTGGKIGNLTIETINDIPDRIKRGIRISSNNGLIFQVKDGNSADPAAIILTVELIGITKNNSKPYYWYKSADGTVWTPIDNKAANNNNYTLTINYNEYKNYLNNNSGCFIKVEYTDDIGDLFTDYVSLNVVSGVLTYGINVSQDRILKTIIEEMNEDGGRTAKTEYFPEELTFYPYERNITTINGLDRSRYKIKFEVNKNILNSNDNDIEDVPFENGWQSINFLIDRPEYLNYNEGAQNWTLYIRKIIEADLSQETKEYSSWLLRLGNALLTDEFLIRAKIFPFDDEYEKELWATAIVSVGYEVADDLAKFSVNANGINMAVQNTKIDFNGSGIIIRNGGITIYDEIDPEKPAFYTENGNLVLRGRIEASEGIFHGRVEAEEGYFKGAVYADEGHFRGSIETYDGYFGGTIYATQGKIANIDIYDNRIGLYDGDKIIYELSGEPATIKLPDKTTEELGQMRDAAKKAYKENNQTLNLSDIQDFINLYKDTFGKDPTIKKIEDFDTIYDELCVGKEVQRMAGKITANFITLGTGAYIDDYIQIGDAYIFNPDAHYGKFIQTNGKDEDTSGIILYEDGTGRFGNIHVDGVNSRIYAAEDTDTYWSLTPDLAQFLNVNVSGRLNTVVFEKTSTTASGGITVFKDSAMIKRYEDIEVKSGTSGNKVIEHLRLFLKEDPDILLDDIESTAQFFAKDNYVGVTGKNNGLVYYSKVIEVKAEMLADEVAAYLKEKTDEEIQELYTQYILSEDPTDTAATKEERIEKLKTNHSVVILIQEENNFEPYVEIIKPKDIGELDLQILIDFGPLNTNNTSRDWVIGINSTNNARSIGLNPNAISFLSFSDNNSTDEEIKLKFDKKIILGSLGLNYDEDYGLYASSAYLNGSITTRYEEEDINDNLNYKYAGINTLSRYPFNKWDALVGEDTSPIVFWAGADDKTPESIQNAPFQVSSNGYVYASRGHFSGSVLSNAALISPRMQTAIIYGMGQTQGDKEASLKIFSDSRIDNIKDGIVFFNNCNFDAGNTSVIESKTEDEIKDIYEMIFNNRPGKDYSKEKILAEIENNITDSVVDKLVENSGIKTVSINPNGIKMQDLNDYFGIFESTEAKTTKRVVGIRKGGEIWGKGLFSTDKIAEDNNMISYNANAAGLYFNSVGIGYGQYNTGSNSVEFSGIYMSPTYEGDIYKLAFKQVSNDSESDIMLLQLDNSILYNYTETFQTQKNAILGKSGTHQMKINQVDDGYNIVITE